MIVPLAATFWILSLALVTALCRAARRGDLQPQGEPFAEPASIELFVSVRDAAAHRSGRGAPSDPVSQPAARPEGESVKPEDASPSHSRTPGDLALQAG
jgi:hypothetical protein